MASSSSKPSCFQCHDSTCSSFKDGWKLRTGEFAQLCHRCASVFEEGRFCETFHSNDDGWRDCESCGKLVHCGCVVSFNAYLLLDFGGVICMECSKINFLLARNHGLAREHQTVPENVPNLARRIQIEPHYWPLGTDSELEPVSGTPQSVVNTLFEKMLTATDTDLKLGRIVIPKKCAETFFPEISEPQGTLLKVLDTEGKEWEFYYRYWPNCGSKMYVLEGLRDFMISTDMQAGDTVTFYRMEPEGKMVIGLRKAPIVKPSNLVLA